MRETTGIVLRGNKLEWAAMNIDRDRRAVIDSGCIDLPWSDIREIESVSEQDLQVAGKGLRGDCARMKGAVTLGIPTDQALLRVIDLPAAGAAELAGMAELQVDKFSPFPAENMVISHEVLSRTGEQCVVLVAAVKRKFITALGVLLKAAGIVPARVDVGIMGWHSLPAVAGDPRQRGYRTVIVAGAHAVEIMIFRDGLPVALRSVSREAGMPDADVAAEVVDEIERNMMAVELGSGDTSACAVFGVEGDGAAAGIMSGVRDALKCEADLKSSDELASPAECIVARQPAPGDTLLDLAPESWREARSAALMKRRLLKASASVIGVWLLCLGSFLGVMQYKRAELRRLESERDRWNAEAADVRDKRNRVNMIRNHADWRQSALECLLEVSRLQPGGIELTSFNYTREQGVKISGYGPDVNTVYGFKSDLDKSNLFDSADLNGPTWSPAVRKQIFDVDLKFSGEPR